MLFSHCLADDIACLLGLLVQVHIKRERMRFEASIQSQSEMPEIHLKIKRLYYFYIEKLLRSNLLSVD